MTRKLLTLSVAATMLLFSCKKEHSNPTDSSSNKTYQVSFNVSSELTQSTTPLISASSSQMHTLAAAKPIPVATAYLTALFYDANSKLLQRVDQTKASTTNYGTISVQLPVGTVYAFFIATDDNSYTLSTSTNNKQDAAKMPKGYPVISYDNSYFGPPTTSVFTKGQALNITAPSTQAISLSRAASRLTVVVDDVPPANTSYTYTQAPPNNALDLLSQTGEHTNIYSSVAQGLNPTAGQSGYTYEAIIWPGVGSTHSFSGYFPSLTPASINKTLFAATDTIKPNTRYRFEGYLTNLRPTTSVITTDTAWNPTINKTFSIKRNNN
ncbi:FimB/Mfa2 family fimbrial subunit [Mucilaginibacter robiniae]|uniref:FimB/Mfa2 family fimbrial subunit n=1 Tax=Mucilaginibacter robiniae TaxID=2728022 RepID=A0A7L5E4L9_9SPHI|nr:hypothetical protein [Mucilaginibacter robiniae]QJD95773.1 FimB/Mfa2 family fimbrial subunit [Mucilaginibacter robiniae]